ncbi:MAG: hypothetical protein HDS75_01020 [Bacteroidales bacterium]|nr:hypothetical protein [Bacteroidales bacterium]MDE6802233.1 hypothetical protein [Muribaculaceae bacterium]MDE6831983.1 hypothetical protein [Muribaculaceae bacterium]
MTEDERKRLTTDENGLMTYEYIANNIETCDRDIDELIDNMIRVDMTGQFVVSAARYLAAVNAMGYKAQIDRLVAAAIEKDREHKYLPDLLTGIYGADYADRADELRSSDDNFRRIYKRLYPTGI